MSDLFGEEIKSYGKGYAAAPGSGPKDKQCRNCHSFYRKLGRWSKCRLIVATTGTDINMFSPACAKFEQTHE